MLKSALYTAAITFLLINLGCSPNDKFSNGTISEDIRINQIGYYPEAYKKAVIVDCHTCSKFSLIDTITNETVFRGVLSKPRKWKLSDEEVRIADFSELKKEGIYVISISEVGQSYPFEIRANVFEEVFKGSIKGLYYQRSGMALEEKYAGKWHRPMGHPDDSVLFHPSSGRSEGYLTSSKGWYDAGDYNKYIINACFPLGQHFRLYEEYPRVVADASLNIPESGNGISDYLDELKYEMDWALTMQDDDGGLFHKLTTKNFEGMVMPHEANSKRFVVGKSTTATLNFAASMAQGHRIFKKVDSNYALRCLKASKAAYKWAEEHPKVLFENPDDIHTGEYGDNDVEDEWFWANAELFVTTQDTIYLNRLANKPFNFEFRPGESWTAYMRFLGIFSLLQNKELLSESIYEELREGILSTADDLTKLAGSGVYFQPINDFHWGSNSDVLNAAMLLAQAYRMQPKQEYLAAIRNAVDYILGCNALGVSFVTGFGHKTPMYIHHRQSASDGIKEPVPGLLSGGPNSRMQDANHGAVYPKDVAPMKAWVDQEPSFASNEICMNWNSPLTYVLGFLQQQDEQ